MAGAEDGNERDVFFLRSIRRRYPAHWEPLLAANIIVVGYVLAPDKWRRFVEELGAATGGTDGLPAVTNLAAIISDAAFCANTNAYRPGILDRPGCWGYFG
ncbi:MAG: hypothetical protein KGL37_04665 [Acidobacteriota bacterium]|nr:hypothetical protein [Acidobacteriota bacterium]